MIVYRLQVYVFGRDTDFSHVEHLHRPAPRPSKPLWNSHMRDDRNPCVGRIVYVVKGVYKNYRGLIKEINADKVLIELEATLRLIRVPSDHVYLVRCVHFCLLSIITLLKSILSSGRKLVPLLSPFIPAAQVAGPSMRPPAVPSTHSIPPSTMPLTASTPLPTSLLGTSPAWDPASRTPQRADLNESLNTEGKMTDCFT